MQSKVAMPCFVAAAFPMCAHCMSIAGTWTTEAGFDYVGNTFASFNVKSYYDCGRQCTDTPGCTAFVFSKPDVMCYLKTKRANVTSGNPGLVSGYLNPALWVIQPTYDYWGGVLLASLDSSTYYDCGQTCMNTPGCHAFVIGTLSDDHKCWMKDTRVTIKGPGRRSRNAGYLIQGTYSSYVGFRALNPRTLKS